MSGPYLMESSGEGSRLLAQEAANPSRERLWLTGLRPGDRALDAGCGAGAVTGWMAEIVGASGSVMAIDLSASRLNEAKTALGPRDNVQFREAGLPDTGLDDASFDFTWSQYVFEYLADPAAALRELVRVTRPGGRVVVAEIDAHGLHNWPMSEALTDGCRSLERALRKSHFDLHIGRKLYGLFRQQGLEDVRVHLHPFYVIAGAADERLLQDWKVRFDALRPAAIPEFGSEAAYDTFCRDYLALLADPDALKYAVILTTEGTRA